MIGRACGDKRQIASRRRLVAVSKRNDNLAKHATISLNSIAQERDDSTTKSSLWTAILLTKTQFSRINRRHPQPQSKATT